MNDAVQFAIAILSNIPVLIQGGSDVVEVANFGLETLKKMKDENRGPTDQEWAQVNEIIARSRSIVHGGTPTSS